jgi:hypothetical protein
MSVSVPGEDGGEGVRGARGERGSDMMVILRDGDGVLPEVAICFIGGADGKRVGLVVSFNEEVSVEVGQGFPAVMCFGETFPPDQVLELVASLPCAQDLLDFPFRLSVH